MVEFYTKPQDLDYPRLDRPRSEGDSGTAQAIASIGSSAIKIGTLFAEGRKRGRLNDYSMGMTDQMLGALNEARALENLPPLNTDEVKNLTDYQVQLRKLSTAEAQKGAATSLRHRTMAYHNKMKTDYPGLSVEFEQLFGAHTGMSFGSMAFDAAAMREEENYNNALDAVANPDVTRNIKLAQSNAAIKIATEAGWDVSGMTVDDIIEKARTTSATAFDIATKNAQMGFESNKMSLLSQQEQLKRLVDPSYSASQDVIGFVVQKFDSTFPEERGVDLETKRRRVGGLLQAEWQRSITDKQIDQWKKDFERDPAFRARVITQRAVEELYSMHSGLEDPSSVPYSEKFKFVKDNFQNEWAIRTDELHRGVQNTYAEGRLKLTVENDAIKRWSTEFGMTEGVDVQRMLDYHEYKTGLEQRYNEILMGAKTAEAQEKAQGALLSEVEAPGLIMTTNAAIINFIKEREEGGITQQEAEEITIQANKLADEARLALTAHPGYANRSKVVNAQIDILNNMRDVAVSYANKKIRSDIATNNITALDAINKWNLKTTAVNPNAPVDQQITGQDIQNAIEVASWWSTEMATNHSDKVMLQENTAALANILSKQQYGILQVTEGEESSFANIAQAFNVMSGSMAKVLQKNGLTPETKTVIDNVVNNFIQKDYEYFSKKDGGIPPDQLKLMGEASLQLLSNKQLKEYFAANPDSGEALKAIIESFQTESVTALKEEVQKELEAHVDPDRINFATFLSPAAREGGDKMTSLIVPDTTGDYFKFTNKYKSFASFKAAMKGKVRDDSDRGLNDLYVKVQNLATKLNRNVASRFQQIAMARSNYNSIPVSQALDEIYNKGLGIFEPTPEEPKTPSQTQ